MEWRKMRPPYFPSSFYVHAYKLNSCSPLPFLLFYLPSLIPLLHPPQPPYFFFLSLLLIFTD